MTGYAERTYSAQDGLRLHYRDYGDTLSPDLPTVGETVKGYSALGWFGLFARSGTPTDVVEKVNASVNKALEMPDIVERAKTMGLDVMAGTPEAFDQTWKDDHQKWGQLIRDLKLER